MGRRLFFLVLGLTADLGLRPDDQERTLCKSHRSGA